jgi:hypothetical protein
MLGSHGNQHHQKIVGSQWICLPANCHQHVPCCYNVQRTNKCMHTKQVLADKSWTRKKSRRTSRPILNEIAKMTAILVDWSTKQRRRCSLWFSRMKSRTTTNLSPVIFSAIPVNTWGSFFFFPCPPPSIFTATSHGIRWPPCGTSLRASTIR